MASEVDRIQWRRTPTVLRLADRVCRATKGSIQEKRNDPEVEE